jgi:hypothetical protein
MQNADAVKRQEMRKQSKKHGEFAGDYLKALTADLVETTDDSQDVEEKLFYMVQDTVHETACELVGQKHLEKQMKKSCIKYAAN